ncbi:MAG: PPOX class F420-dependent oxidoreductase [Chloroflexi bacterium]|nr:MAG: PPOX class F420-dependent oxidoreductase [Chloroflexota bacterium]TMD65154.1 MAG: PPOX class F420-dependent oxidoreductase [Chloroflexota bacterium]
MIDLDRARQFLRVRHDGILVTLKRDGRPQLSNILYFLDDDGRLKISVTQARAKTRNLRRDPRASLHVQGRDRYEYLVAEGNATFIEGDGLAEALRHYYRKVRGDHPDWAEYDAAMIKEERLLLSLSVDRAYGQLR